MHFLGQQLLCSVAEDVDLLPRGLFTKLLSGSVNQPERFSTCIEELLTATRDGGDCGVEALDRFNRRLFATIGATAFTDDDLVTLVEVGLLDWASVEPATFGWLFECSLDPGQRA